MCKILKQNIGNLFINSVMATTKFSKAVTSGVCEELHEYDWEIKNWELVQVDENLVKDQKFEILAGHKSALLSKWTIGLEVAAADANGNRYVGIYGKLTELTGDKTNVPISFGAHVENPNGGFYWQPAAISKSMKLNEICNHVNTFEFNKPSNPAAVNYLKDGSVTIAIRLRVLNPISVPQTVGFAMEQFQRNTSELLRIDYGNLLDNENGLSDLTIISRDREEFPCHKLILTARNSVFATMLGTELSEKKTGVVNISDLSGKTVKVLLHYLYTGQLLDSWKDSDVIVEFTYAAGKYQLKEVLEMLDNMLGQTKGKTSGTSLLLLELASKLSLKKAETELMERIVKFAMTAEHTGDMLTLMKTEVPNRTLPSSPQVEDQVVKAEPPEPVKIEAAAEK